MRKSEPETKFEYIEPVYITALKELQLFVEFSRLVSLYDLEAYEFLTAWEEEKRALLVRLGADNEDVCVYVTLLITRSYSPNASKGFISKGIFALRWKLLSSLRAAARTGRGDGELLRKALRK